MSAQQKFRMFFGSRAATTDELAHVEEISVEQELDLAWQATIKLSLCLDAKGSWAHQQAEFLRSFQRVRVEIQLAGKAWTPLIDGPIVDRQTDMDSQPGRSNCTSAFALALPTARNCKPPASTDATSTRTGPPRKRAVTPCAATPFSVIRSVPVNCSSAPSPTGNPS